MSYHHAVPLYSRERLIGDHQRRGVSFGAISGRSAEAGQAGDLCFIAVPVTLSIIKHWQRKGIKKQKCVFHIFKCTLKSTLWCNSAHDVFVLASVIDLCFTCVDFCIQLLHSLQCFKALCAEAILCYSIGVRKMVCKHQQPEKISPHILLSILRMCNWSTNRKD